MAVWRRERDSYFWGVPVGVSRKEKGGIIEEKKRKNVARPKSERK